MENPHNEDCEGLNVEEHNLQRDIFQRIFENISLSI